MLGRNFKTVVLTLALAGCTTASPPGIKVEYVDRPVIQLKSCIEAKDVPEAPSSLSSGVAPDNLETALSLALAKVSEWTRYGHKSDVILKGCSQ